ncbi:MAG: bifunctional (p)ppGpp synthetase/guanosine-3',5'-bis(diphosphate) 3'-pyrophosphohydrolase [Deltaproteobacteria bacterium]|nr:bifunctional (p)ppGpp synthetase/guanosine-3',5'-bis(diphosphate) 3'-pyrophosphohydrolase [Deltaproteobacteria bacterium]
MIRVHDIIDQVASYQPKADVELIQRAYVFAAKAHQGQTRRSGEPYLIHPMEVAGLLAAMRLDVASITTGILHDTIEDTVATLEELEKLFGKEVAKLVDGVTKLGKLHFRTSEEKQAENFRKMIMAMAEDIRVILVKLADRLHNMRTLEHLAEAKQVEIAQETMDIYAPIANRLGMQQMKIELEDLAFRFLKPDVFRTISERVESRRAYRERFIKEVQGIAEREIAQHKIACEIQGRQKHMYSIHRKMERQSIPFDEVHDLVAFRIVVDDLAKCYEALGVLHSLWRPVPGRFKDYIAMPKQNNYQSLHTTVMGPHGERCEFQIRTREMHEIAELGIAAHWRYKESGRNIRSRDEQKFKWVRQLLQWQRELNEPAEFLDTIKLDLFADDIYAFSPKGTLMELPRGATPVDFAYAIHTDVGHACIGAKVNGRIVPLRYQLRSGDTVEILVGKQKRPNKDWLGFVKTSRAKAKIRQVLREDEHDQARAIGRELLEKAGAAFGWSVAKLTKAPEIARYLQDQAYREFDSLLAAIGYGKVQPAEVLGAVVTKEQFQQMTPAAPPQPPPQQSTFSKIVGKLTRRARSPVRISGISDVLISFGKCCNPVPGDSIVGFVTRGRGVSVHTSDCTHVLGSDPERCIPVEWDVEAGTTRIARVRVECVDRPGMLASLTEAITDQGVNIVAAHAKTLEDQKGINTFEIEIHDLQQLRQVLHGLEKVKGVITVERVKG